MATIAEQLDAMAVTDSLKAGSIPASFTALPWATDGGTWSLTDGWRAQGFSSAATAGSRSGAYYNTATVTGGAAVVIVKYNKLSPGNLINERQFATWLFSEAGVKASGYQLVAYQTTASEPTDKIFDFKLRKWVAGAETLLVEVKEVTLEVGGEIALVRSEGKVSIWVKKSATSEWTLQGAEIADGAFTEGRSGFDANGSNPNLTDFRTGTLEEEEEEEGVHKPGAATATASVPTPEISAPMQPDSALATASVPSGVDLVGGAATSATEREAKGLPLPHPSVLANPGRLGPPRFTSAERKTLRIDRNG